jgi:hypothetical protein
MRNLAGTVGPDGILNSPEALPHFGSYIRGLAAKRTAQPSPGNAWRLGLGIAAATGERWCNPVLMLFLTGHFAHYAAVMLFGDESLVDREKKIAMARHVMTVVEPTAPADPASTRAIVLGLSGSELTAQRASHWDKITRQRHRLDRAAWEIDGTQLAGFIGSWDDVNRDGLDCGHPTIAACHLAAEGILSEKVADIEFAMRSRIAADAVLAALS